VVQDVAVAAVGCYWVLPGPRALALALQLSTSEALNIAAVRCSRLSAGHGRGASE